MKQTITALWTRKLGPMNLAERNALLLTSVLGLGGMKGRIQTAPWLAGQALPPHARRVELRPKREAPIPGIAWQRWERGFEKPRLRLRFSSDAVALHRSGSDIAYRPSAASRNGLASTFGPALVELTDAPVWRSAAEPGWVAGIGLTLQCPRHARPVDWWWWAHPDAPTRDRRHLLRCPDCSPTDADGVLRGKGMLTVLDAAARLQSERGGASDGHAYSIYVLEVRGGEKSPEVYVGMTTKTVAERVEQHRSGVRPAARVFRSGWAQVGSLRLDLVPDLGPLTNFYCARAAEQYVNALLSLTMRVAGD